MPADFDQLMKSLDKIEENMNQMSDKADEEIKNSGKLHADTKAAIEKLGNDQREFAERLTEIEQRGSAEPGATDKDESWGEQFVKSSSLQAYREGSLSKFRVEVKTDMVGSDTNVAPDRRPGVVPGAFVPLTIEAFLPSSNTTSNAIEYTKENVFTNSAAEAAEGAQKGESTITWSLVNMPVSTVAHFIRISKQLTEDNAALVSYVNTRMKYGVNKRVETQLVVGNGTPPNISGILDTGNTTAHGYLSGDIGSTLPAIVLIRKIMADSWAAGYPADGILLNPADWAGIEIQALTTAAGQVPLNYTSSGTPMLWGVRVVQSPAMTADTVAVGAFGEAFRVFNRSGVIVELSDSDGDNFQKNMVTMRAERRLALASEVPAAVRAGDLTPPAT